MSDLVDEVGSQERRGLHFLHVGDEFRGAFAACKRADANLLQVLHNGVE